MAFTIDNAKHRGLLDAIFSCSVDSDAAGSGKQGALKDIAKKLRLGALKA
jgi:hypothetical protein